MRAPHLPLTDQSRDLFFSFYIPGVRPGVLPVPYLPPPVSVLPGFAAAGARCLLFTFSPIAQEGTISHSGTVTHLDIDTQGRQRAGRAVSESHSLKNTPTATTHRTQAPILLLSPTHLRVTNVRGGVTKARLCGPRACALILFCKCPWLLGRDVMGLLRPRL